MLLLFVSFLPFTTAIAATHLFASNLSFHEITVSSSTERVAAVVFGLNLTLAALIVYLMLRHAGPGGRRRSRGRTAGLRQRTPVSSAAAGRSHRGGRLPAADRRGLLPGPVGILRPRSAPAHAYPQGPPGRDERRTRRVFTCYHAFACRSRTISTRPPTGQPGSDYVPHRDNHGASHGHSREPACQRPGPVAGQRSGNHGRDGETPASSATIWRD